MKEIPPSPENPELRGMLVSLLREKGPFDPETQEVLQRWEDEQERIADQSPTAEGRIRHCIARAEMYLEAGYNEAGLENLADAGEQAWQEENEELYGKVIASLFSLLAKIKEEKKEKRDD
jgi:hypothetical protein